MARRQFRLFLYSQFTEHTFRSEQFGTSGDNPTVSGDWDADGKSDLAVYRSASTGGGQSFFYYRPSAQSSVNFVPVQWGTSGDISIFGDFDGDRKIDAADYRPSNNTFYVRQSSTGAMLSRQWGNASTDAIFAGDFDGDGKSDFAVQRFSGADAGFWYVAQSGGTNRAFQWVTICRFRLITTAPAEWISPFTAARTARGISPRARRTRRAIRPLACQTISLYN